LADVRKSIRSMLTTSPTHVWSEVGGSHQGYTSASSETPGEPDSGPVFEKGYPSYDAVNNTNLDKAMKAPIEDKLRKAGM